MPDGKPAKIASFVTFLTASAAFLHAAWPYFEYLAKHFAKH